MDLLKMYSLLKMGIIYCHVSLLEGTIYYVRLGINPAWRRGKPQSIITQSTAARRQRFCWYVVSPFGMIVHLKEPETAKRKRWILYMILFV